jgi:hypothetical protein
MWWTGQNLERPLLDVDGRRWHFRVWHDFVDGVYTQRIFFWDEARTETGWVELAQDQVLHVSQIKQRIRRLITDAADRERHRRARSFPVERHHA